MPSDAADSAGIDLPDWDLLERRVRGLMHAHASILRRAEAAEARVRELEGTLRDVSTGQLDPLALAERTQLLERENRTLNERLERARNSVQRILARMRFVEEEP
jgi:hypothetical protein